jgi:FKBP-type peptidyl-prolyl cis-trans isomerase SlyD
MEIGKDNVVNMHYTLRDPSGKVLDSSEGGDPLAYLHGHGNLIPGLERQLEGQGEGAELIAEVPAAEAYGEHSEERVVSAQRSQFPEGVDLQPGMQFEASTPQGPQPAVIAGVDGDTVTVDLNHPLAGVDLKFEVKVISIREASPTELEHGHVHQGGDKCGH